MWSIQVPTMEKYSNRALDFKVAIPYIPEDDKEADPSGGNPPSVLLLEDTGEAIDNRTIQVQPIFNSGSTEQFFKWFKSIFSSREGQSVGEHFRLALQALVETDKALWQKELYLASPKLASSSRMLNNAAEKLWYDSIVKLAAHVFGFKQVGYIERYLWIGKNTGILNFMDHLDILLTYLPLFPPLKGEVLKELSDQQKATIVYDALPRYNIKKIRKLIQSPSQ
jgi:hypothetical protein